MITEESWSSSTAKASDAPLFFDGFGTIIFQCSQMLFAWRLFVMLDSLCSFFKIACISVQYLRDDPDTRFRNEEMSF